jgi:arylsulfatase
MFVLREQRPPYAYAPISDLVDGAIALLARSDPSRPVFLYLHTVDPHGPYQPPSRYLPADAPPPNRRDYLSYWQLLDSPSVTPAQREVVLASYDGEIAYTDAELGRLFDALRQQGLYDRAMIVVTSDHGEHFQEHGLWGHGKSLYEPLLDVPLLVKYPSQHEPRVVDARVGTIDLFPTVLRAIGEDCAACDGRPLQDVEAGDSRALLAYQMGDDEAKPVRRSILEGRFKLVRTSRDGSEQEELFDLEQDPGEQRDLRAEHPDVAARLAGRLRDYEQAAGSAPKGDPIRLAPSEVERLESLGYLQ